MTKKKLENQRERVLQRRVEMETRHLKASEATASTLSVRQIDETYEDLSGSDNNVKFESFRVK